MHALIAAISGNDVGICLVWLVIAGVVFFLLNWMVGYIGLGEPFSKIAKVVIAILVVVMVLNALLTLTGNRIIG